MLGSVSAAGFFVSYVLMFVAHGMLVTKSREGSSSYSYNTITVVLLSEMLKLVLAGVIYVKDDGLSTLLLCLKTHKFIFLLYMVPAVLYCLSNNISFLSLSYFNPTTYLMFMQIRLLLTGVIYQILFRRQLSMRQWVSLVVLTTGCMTHAAGLRTGSVASQTATDSDPSIEQIGIGCIFILTQILCSVFAGVYTEYIIKGEGSDVHIMMQNVFMYLDSIFCNIFLLSVKGDLLSAFTAASVASINKPLVLLIILNNSILGLATSIFLKKLNSILKAFASAIELVITAIVSVPVLGIPLTINTVMAMGLISIAVVMYAQNPVQNSNSNTDKQVLSKVVKIEDL